MSLQLVFPLLFAAFCCHDGEEILTMERWLRRNRDWRIAGPEAKLINWQKPVTAQFAVAVSVVGAVVLAASWVGSLTYAETGRLHGLFVGVLAVMLLDGVKHVLLSLYRWGYTPGVVTAACVELPFSLYAFSRLFGADLLTMNQALVNGLIGLALVPPLLAAGFALGRWVVPMPRKPGIIP